MTQAKDPQAGLTGDITPYDQRGIERRQGDRRRNPDRRTGRDDSLGMRLYRLIRTSVFHLPEMERCLPDRRRGERRAPDGPANRRGAAEKQESLLSQEEIRFLLKGGIA